MRRIVRRTATIVTVQTWTVTWVEEEPAAEPSLAAPLLNAAAAPALPPGPADEAPAPRSEAPDSSRPASDAG